MVVVNNRFAAVLGAKKLKISDAHRMTGISRTTLTKLYYGTENAVTYTVLAKICEALQCDVSDLLVLVEAESNG